MGIIGRKPTRLMGAVLDRWDRRKQTSAHWKHMWKNAQLSRRSHLLFFFGKKRCISECWGAQFLFLGTIGWARYTHMHTIYIQYIYNIYMYIYIYVIYVWLCNWYGRLFIKYINDLAILIVFLMMQQITIS